jgi:hypothetical protein
MGRNNGYNRYNDNGYLLNHLFEFIGQTVTIFTASGGVSGCGFTGVLIKVNCDYVRIVVQQGTPPVNPINFSSCCGNNNSQTLGEQQYQHYQPYNSVGSVCDIPVRTIVSFCHNSV